MRCPARHAAIIAQANRGSERSDENTPLCNEVTGAPKYGVPVFGTSYL